MTPKLGLGLLLLLLASGRAADQAHAFGRRQGEPQRLLDASGIATPAPLRCKGRRRRRRSAPHFASACDVLARFGAAEGKGGALLVLRPGSGKRVVVSPLADGRPSALLQVFARGVNHGAILPSLVDEVRVSDYMFRAFALQAPGSFAAVRGSCLRKGVAPVLAFEHLALGVLGSSIIPEERSKTPLWHAALGGLPERQQSANRVSMLRDIAKALALMHGEVPNLLGERFVLCDFRANQFAVGWALGPCFGGAGQAAAAARCLRAKLVDMDNVRAITPSRFSVCNYDDHPPEYGFPPELKVPKYGMLRAAKTVPLDAFQSTTLFDLVLDARIPSSQPPAAPRRGGKYARAEVGLQQRLRAGVRHATPSKRWTTLRAWQEIDRVAVTVFGAASEFPWRQDLARLRKTLLQPHWPACESSCNESATAPEPCISAPHF